MIPFFLLLPLALVGAASTKCSRKMLKQATKEYVEAQMKGDIDILTSLAADHFRYSENDMDMDITTSVLNEAIDIDFDRSIHDTTRCRTFTEIISANNDHPYVIATRMLFTNNTITDIESIVSDRGDWAFNATGYLYWNSLEEWGTIPRRMRDSRKTIQAAGDAYFDRFNDVNVDVPFGTPCARLEGGAYTGRGDPTGNSCIIGGMPSNIKVTNRRYVVDETMGVVSIFLGFPGLDRSQGQDPMPDSHMFRVEDGEIRYIHTVSACVEKGCGMNGEGPPGE